MCKYIGEGTECINQSKDGRRALVFVLEAGSDENALRETEIAIQVRVI